MPNMKPLDLLTSEKKIFEDLVLGYHGNQTLAWNYILLATLVGDYARIIYVKFGDNLTSGFRRDVV